jgi:hypothetical protein
MSVRICVVCGEALPAWARVDKTTCGPACRSRFCRTREATSNAFATSLGATTARSDRQEGREPVRSQTGPLAASGEADQGAFDPVMESGTGQRLRHSDSLVLVLARYVEALHARYPEGPDQMRRESLDARANIRRMRKNTKGRAA